MGAADAAAPDLDPYALEPLTQAEYEALRADISERGILVPIEVDSDGQVLDGHHRLRAAGELQLPSDQIPTVMRFFADEREKMRHVLALNTFRRHLSRPRRQQWLFEYEQLSFAIDPTRYPRPHAVPRRRAVASAAPINTAERQRLHRLKERLRPKNPVTEGTDPWELANEALIRLERLRPAAANNPHLALELEAIMELVRQLAWGPE